MGRQQRDVIIIGSGLAGTSAALQAARSGLDVLVLSKPGSDGYWSKTNKIDLLPGFSEPVVGKEVIERTKEHAVKYGAIFHDFDVASVEKTETSMYKVAGENGETYIAPAIIVATGVSKSEHLLVGEKEFAGRGVYYSVENEAPLLKHHTAGIIGKSKETAEAALRLSKFAEKIYFIIPSSKLDIPDNLFKELEANSKIEMLFSSSVKKLNGSDELYSVTVLSAGTEREIKTKSLFVFTYNLQPSTEFIKDLIKRDEETGRILVNSEFATSNPGIFACGDVLCGTLQNPTISSAQGMLTAINAEKFLNAS